MSLWRRHPCGMCVATVLLCMVLVPKSTQAGIPNCTAHKSTIESFQAKTFPERLFFLQVNFEKMENMTCGMVVTAAANQIIAFQFLRIGWSSVNDTCLQGEYLEIFDGSSSASKSIHRECKGSSHVTTFYTSGPNGYIELNTALSSNKTNQFVIINIVAVNRSDACTGRTDIQAGFNSSQEITSPYNSYDLDYPSNTSCSWWITAPPNHVVIIEAKSSVNCDGSDQLEIYNSKNAESQHLLGRLCRASLYYTTFSSTGEDIFVSFQSNATFQDRWTYRRYFLLKYHTYKPECRNGKLTALNASSTTQTIRSPKARTGGDYPANSNCSWHITAPPGHVIKIQVDSKVWCIGKDYLKIYDSDSSVVEDLLGIPCWSTSEKPVYYSSRQDIYISFTSSAKAAPTLQEKSFTIEYSAFKPGTTCSPVNTADQNKNIFIEGLNAGIIQSPDFPNKFPNNLDCVWKFHAPPNHVVKLYVDTIDLKASSCLYNRNGLKIFDGYSLYDTLLYHEWCYYTSRDNKGSFPVASSGKTLSAHFTSGSTTTKGYGFTANFTMQPIHVASTGACVEGQTGQIHITAQASSIKSPGFSNVNEMKLPKNMTCIWNITVDPDYVIRVKVFKNQLSLGCKSSEYARFIDGGTLNSPTMFTLCKNNKPFISYSTTNNIMIELKTSPAEERYGGFFVSYLAVKKAPFSYSCTSNWATNLKDSTFRIASYGYPQLYPNNVFCRWLYTAEFGKRARLNITKLELQDSSNCQADYVRVSGSDYFYSPKLGQFCGKPKTPIVLTSSGRALLVEFIADWMGRFPGFEGTFEGIEDNSYGSCDVQGRDNLIPLNGTSGNFFSPRYPNRVPQSISCIWHITAPKGSYIKLIIKNFRLDYFCKDVHLEVRTGSPQDLSSKLIGRYCGDKKVPPIFTPGNSLWVQLKSNDQRSTARGFTASYSVVNTLPLSISCRDPSYKTIKAPSGQIATYDYPLKYESNVSCQWSIVVDSSKRVKLTFESFSLEDSSGCTGDHVAIYDGSSFSDLLGKYCGSKTPDPVYSSGSRMYIKFATDGKGRYQGFKASFESVLSTSTIVMIVSFTLMGVGALISLIVWCVRAKCFGMCASSPQQVPADGTSVAGSNFQLTSRSTNQ